MLRGKGRRLKPLLLDQTFLAGLGNIYVDEALWQARLHPLRRAASLSAVEIGSLHKAVREVLTRGIRNLGTTLGKADTNFYSVGKRRGRNQDGLKVFRRTGRPCPRCQTTIQRILVGQRSTHICPECQREF
jgi:formamidopyrimidine-DNA glycosylase